MIKNFLTIQWHVTEKCNNQCRHCYMTREKKELSCEEMLKILKNIDDFEKKWNFEIRNYIITGGDPFLYDNIEFLFKELKKRNKNITILGNPDTITIKTLNLLKKYNIENFQMSIDGLKERHDYIRKEGSFDLTLEKANFLEKNGVFTNIMFTVNLENYKDLIPVMEIVAKNNISGFSFDFLCSTGNGKSLNSLTNIEVDNLLKEYLKKKEELNKTSNTFFGEKSALFRKLRDENNNFILSKFTLENRPYLGCYVGYTSFAIASDGSFMPCRRLNEKYGNLLVEKLEDIFLGDERLKKYRRAEFYDECGACKYFNFCRGCPAVSKGETGFSLKKLSLCSYKIEHSTIQNSKIKLDTSKEEERKIVSKHYMNVFFNNFENNVLKNKKLFDFILLVTFESEIRKRFVKEPYKIFQELKIKFTKEELEMIAYYVELLYMGYTFDLRKYIFGE